MQVWFWNHMPWPHGTVYDRAAATNLYDSYVEMFRRADDLGYDGLAFAEHHSSKSGSAPSPNLIAAAIATHTSHARIVPMGNCLPMHGHPVRLAEELAMIDVLSHGRLTAGFIRGGASTYRAYSVDISQGRSMFEEAWELIVKAWTEDDPFSWQGEHYHYDAVSIVPRPVQRPHPPLAEAAQTAESIEWAARHHAPLLVGGLTMAQAADAFAHYRTYAQQECGWTPAPEHTGMSRAVYVGVTDAKAREEGEQHALVHHVEGTERGVRSEESNQVRRSDRSFAYRSDESKREAPPPVEAGLDELMRQGYCCVGSPDTVTRWVKELERRLQIGILLTPMPFGGMEPEQATRSLELFGKEVLPNLQ